MTASIADAAAPGPAVTQVAADGRHRDRPRAARARPSSRSTSSTTASSSRTPGRRPPTTSSAASSRSSLLVGRGSALRPRPRRAARDDRAARRLLRRALRHRGRLLHARGRPVGRRLHRPALDRSPGSLLLGLGAVTLWRSRRRDDARWWRYPAGCCSRPAALFVAYGRPVAGRASPTSSRTPPARSVPAADLGAPYEDVEFRTSDGLLLKGWYVPSRNGAAVISFPGRRRHAGAGEAAGAPRLRRAALRPPRRGRERGRPERLRLARRARHPRGRRVPPAPAPTSIRDRIGGIGLSVGGEMMIEAAAESTALRAIVSEGASGRSVRDDLAQPRHSVGQRARRRGRDGRDVAVHRRPAAGDAEEPRAEDPRRGVLRLRRARPAGGAAGQHARSTQPPTRRSRSGRSRARATSAASTRSRASTSGGSSRSSTAPSPSARSIATRTVQPFVQQRGRLGLSP